MNAIKTTPLPLQCQLGAGMALQTFMMENLNPGAISMKIYDKNVNLTTDDCDKLDLVHENNERTRHFIQDTFDELAKVLIDEN